MVAPGEDSMIYFDGLEHLVSPSSSVAGSVINSIEAQLVQLFANAGSSPTAFIALAA